MMIPNSTVDRTRIVADFRAKIGKSDIGGSAERLDETEPPV